MGIYPDETIVEKDSCTPMFITALFIVAKAWKQPKCPLTDKWKKKLCGTHTPWNITQQ